MSEDQYRYALNEEAHQLLKHLLPAPDPDSDELYPVTQEIFQKIVNVEKKHMELHKCCTIGKKEDFIAGGIPLKLGRLFTLFFTA